jgi:hypothetical protein
MASKTSSKGQQALYTVYQSQSRWKSNRERKLLRALERNPNNKQIEAALKNIKYRRKAPKTNPWTKTKKREAQLIKQVCGNCPHDVFSSNTKLADQTLASLRNKFDPKTLGDLKVSFKLGDRIHGFV